MTGLEALEKFEELNNTYEEWGNYTEEINAIEKELKQKEALEFMLKRILTSAKAHFAGDDEIFKISLTIIDNSEVANYLKEILKK